MNKKKVLDIFAAESPFKKKYLFIFEYLAGK